MPTATFFPSPEFAWAFYLVLAGLTLVAAYVDWQRLVVPKPLVALTLLLGLGFNVARGVGLAGQGQAVYFFGPGGPIWGGSDGLLFSLAGFGIGFGLFFIMWILGTCGGGDVKWFAALGAWLGPLWSLYILMGTWVVVMFGFVVVGWAVHFVRYGRKPRKAQVAYSFPVAVSTIAILAWVCRAELGLIPPGSVGTVPQAAIQSSR
ncbi:MAG TPA: prepilin peptidase [Gemmatales bacterium]|nr:prepilin peptidase [Gemmatales bacterium]HMP61038.1 prepilin peptidase [Gemmatales bacterium]